MDRTQTLVSKRSRGWNAKGTIDDGNIAADFKIHKPLFNKNPGWLYEY
jgi:hypothetical protein